MSDADFAEIEQQLRRAHEALINQASIETTLRAEVERLREALVGIARNTCCDGCQEAARVAHTALGGTDGR